MSDTRFKKGQVPHNKIEDVDHGDWHMYNRGCRCQLCKIAVTKYHAQTLGKLTRQEIRALPCKLCGIGEKMTGKAVCRPCHNEDQRQRTNARGRRLSPEQYQEMLKAQGGVCVICRQPETRKSKLGKIKELAEDHIHGTDHVRGLLCSFCNKGLGIFRDNPELLRMAAIYVEERQK